MMGALHATVGTTSVPRMGTFSEQIAARTLYGEARGEIEDGQRAVAHVLQNRLKDGRWGNTLATVCLWPFQFSCWGPRDPNLKLMAALPDDDPMLNKLAGFVRAAQTEPSDPTKGSTHYFSTSMILPPDWATGAEFVVQIGNHKFYRGVR